MAATHKCTDDAEFKSFPFFFAPAHRSRTDTHTAHGANGTLTQNLAGKGGSALGKVSSASIKNDVAHRDRAAMGFLVTITTSRQSGIASSSATAAPPSCPVPPRIIAAKF
jgi:hypothetical protein